MLSTLTSWLDTRSVLVFVLTFLSGLLISKSRRDPRHPPGPTRYPLIGNLPQMIISMRKHQSQFKMFEEFSKTYGGIFSLYTGSRWFIVVTDYQLIKEILHDRANEFNDRPINPLFEMLFQGNGILFSSGDKWRAIRKFTIAALKDFGVGSRTLERIIQDEAQTVCVAMAAQDRPFRPKQLISDAITNIICNIIFGNRFEYDDPDFHMIIEKTDFMAKHIGPILIDNFLPFLKYLPIDTPFKKLKRNRLILEEYTFKRIAEHKASFDTNNIRDYIDLYIKISKEGGKSSELTEPHLFQAILDLYFAGAETTATSMDWFVLYMVVHSEVQEKCRQEIDKVVGHSRKVNMQDRVNLPYVQATLNEMQRVANIAPLTVPHMNTNDAMLGGYFLPRRTGIIPAIMSPHRNGQYFENPEEFRPERWLSKDNKLRKIDQHMPFGLGPHRCLGENLAKMEMFIFASNFLQQYIFQIPDGYPTPSLEGIHTGVTLSAQPYEIVVKQRW